MKIPEIISTLVLMLASSFAQAETFYEMLQAHYAPLIYQETANLPKADTITRVDYDGNFDGSDNWENLTKFPVPAFAYSSVIESKTHFFIAYGFFHARDYSAICAIWVCHENDMEGAIFTVEKDGSPFGKLVLVETLAHISIASNFSPTLRLDPVTGESRVALYIERQGHGVHVLGAAQVVDPKHLLLLRPGVSEDPGGRASGVFQYGLLPIEKELWDRRTLVGSHGLFSANVDYIGARFSIKGIPMEFNGNNFLGASKPQAPWGWKGIAGVAEGDFFFDPALVVSRHPQLAKVSLEYVYDPYLGVR